MPTRILQKKPSAFATLGVFRLISFMGLLEHPNGLHEYQKRLSRKRPNQFDLLSKALDSALFLRWDLEMRILAKFVFFSGKSQKNLASFFGLFDERIVSDNKEPVSTTLILQ